MNFSTISFKIYFFNKYESCKIQISHLKAKGMMFQLLDHADI